MEPTLANVDARVKRLIIQRARKYGIDPAAALAVAAGEGGIRYGAVGDQGTSFGPFQLRIGGANPHKDPRRAAAFANSPAGIDYALRKMSESGAKGLKGGAAVNAIVRNFERPADPDTSVSRALARLGSMSVKGGQSAPAPVVRQTTSSPAIPQQAFGTLNEIFQRVGLNPLGIVGDLPLSVPGRGAAPPSAATPAAPAQTLPVPANGKVPRLPKLDLALHLIQKAQEMGLTVRENPYVDGVDPVHVKGSDHYRVVGKKGGKKVGAGADVSGDPDAMRAFFQYASRYAGKGLKDLFHDPVGYSFDNGRRWDKTIGGHGKHVHWSVG
jgi:hypothetical protein